MINILLDGSNIDADWLYGTLKKYIKPAQKVTVVAFSFAESIRSADMWEKLYTPRVGRYYDSIVGAFAAYGIGDDDVTFVNYFTDTPETAARKIMDADILYFPGGNPVLMMQRIDRMGLRKTILQHDGVVMGFSAGALIQMEEYHLSPDDDFPEFMYSNGLPWLRDFYLEVHYEGNEVQDEAINRVLAERDAVVYATACGKGAILAAEGRLTLLGDVRVFTSR